MRGPELGGASAPSAAWFSPGEFHAFTPAHVVVALVCAGLICGSVVLGRRWRGGAAELRLRWAWILGTVAWQGAAVVYWLSPPHFDPRESLPLHLCDLAAWVAPAALATRWAAARALLYFWAIGLSTQAFFTPVVRSGYGTYEFWLFWVGHVQIVGSAVYDAAVLGYRPTFGHFWRVQVVNLVIGGVVVAANQVVVPACFGCGPANYWYLGSDLPGTRTIIHALGPWPGRLVWLVLLAMTAQLVALVPWGVARARATGARRARGAGEG